MKHHYAPHDYNQNYYYSHQMPLVEYHKVPSFVADMIGTVRNQMVTDGSDFELKFADASPTSSSSSSSLHPVQEASADNNEVEQREYHPCVTTMSSITYESRNEKLSKMTRDTIARENQMYDFRTHVPDKYMFQKRHQHQRKQRQTTGEYQPEIPWSSSSSGASSTSTTFSSDEEAQERLSGASGCAGAVVGLVVGGPLLAAVAGLGLAYAVRKQGTTGDIARALGEVALSVSAKSYELDEKHQITVRTHQAITESKMATQARDAVVSGWDSAVEFNRQHQLLERCVEGTGRGIEYLAENLAATVEEQTRTRYEALPYEDPDLTDSTYDGTFY